MILRDRKTNKIINHQELATWPFKPETLMSSETEVQNWPYNENNLYSHTKRYCKERMGVSVVTHSNASVE